MRRLGWAALGLLAALALAVGGLVAWVGANADPRFDVPAPPLAASSDPEVVARGAYLVNHVAHCSDCHAPKGGDLAVLSGGDPIVTPFGTFWPSNLTPHETGIARYDDARLARVIRHGVRADGSLSAFMKVAVGGVADEDLVAVISYLRTLPPVAREVPAPEPNLVGEALFAFGLFQPAFKEIPPYVGPSEAPSVGRGRYLAAGPANCVGCHTAADPMQDMAFTNAPFSGGGPHPSAADPSMVYVPPNLTPAGVTARYDEDAFVARFREGSAWPDSLMPWRQYAGMSDADLRSVYRFLMSLPPVENDPGPPYRRADEG